MNLRFCLPWPDWERVIARDAPEREGRPIVGVDLGGGRAWSAAVAVWGNGRVEARAVAPGIPDLDEQERSATGCQPGYIFKTRMTWGSLRLPRALRVQPAGGHVGFDKGELG